MQGVLLPAIHRGPQRAPPGELATPKKAEGSRCGPLALLSTVALFSAVLLWEQSNRPGYSAQADPIALLGVGDPWLAAIFNASLLALGLGTGAFASWLPARYRIERPLLVAIGTDLALAGIFPDSVPFHWVFGTLLYILPALAIWTFLVHFALTRTLHLTMLTGACVLMGSLGLLFTLTGAVGSLGPGGAERLIDYAGLAWGAVIGSVALYRPRLLRQPIAILSDRWDPARPKGTRPQN